MSLRGKKGDTLKTQEGSPVSAAAAVALAYPRCSPGTPLGPEELLCVLSCGPGRLDTLRPTAGKVA